MHAARADHMQTAPLPDYWEGSQTGMASDVIIITPLTVQQEVPSLQVITHAPQTQVIPELEQGEGRSPGWKMGWMRKNIPYAPTHILAHMQKHNGPLRAEQPLGIESIRKLNRPSQTVTEHIGTHPPVNLEPPHNETGTAAAPTLQTWGEPL